MGLANRDDGWRIPDWLWERRTPEKIRALDAVEEAAHVGQARR